MILSKTEHSYLQLLYMACARCLQKTEITHSNLETTVLFADQWLHFVVTPLMGSKMKWDLFLGSETNATVQVYT